MDVGAGGGFDYYWNYAHQNRALFTPRAFSFYLATWCAPMVKLSPHPIVRWSQLYRGMKTGNMGLRTLTFAVIYAAVPVELRRKVRHSISSLFSFWGQKKKQLHFQIEAGD
jgi:hypothetical protein